MATIRVALRAETSLKINLREAAEEDGRLKRVK